MRIKLFLYKSSSERSNLTQNLTRLNRDDTYRRITAITSDSATFAIVQRDSTQIQFQLQKFAGYTFTVEEIKTAQA